MRQLNTKCFKVWRLWSGVPLICHGWSASIATTIICSFNMCECEFKMLVCVLVKTIRSTQCMCNAADMIQCDAMLWWMWIRTCAMCTSHTWSIAHRAATRLCKTRLSNMTQRCGRATYVCMESWLKVMERHAANMSWLVGKYCNDYHCFISTCASVNSCMCNVADMIQCDAMLWWMWIRTRAMYTSHTWSMKIVINSPKLKPYELTGNFLIQGPKPYDFPAKVVIHSPKPYEFS